jgi:hypothetical protein
VKNPIEHGEWYWRNRIGDEVREFAVMVGDYGIGTHEELSMADLLFKVSEKIRDRSLADEYE